jgi:hypothetical protein
MGLVCAGAGVQPLRRLAAPCQRHALFALGFAQQQLRLLSSAIAVLVALHARDTRIALQRNGLTRS